MEVAKSQDDPVVPRWVSLLLLLLLLLRFFESSRRRFAWGMELRMVIIAGSSSTPQMSLHSKTVSRWKP